MNHEDLRAKIAAYPVERLRELHLHMLIDWADDDTRIREIASKHGIDVEGDKWGVPGIVEIAESMSERITALEGATS